MNPMTAPLLMELDQEAAATRRVLERIPEDKLAWKPHAKSYSLGELGLHTAAVAGGLARMLSEDTFEITAPFTQSQATSRAQMLAALDENVATVRTMIEGLTPERAAFIWKMKAGGKEVIAAPRIALVRALVFNHVYHHRGQLLVYLRLLDVAVPSVYGPTADENPFM